MRPTPLQDPLPAVPRLRSGAIKAGGPPHKSRHSRGRLATPLCIRRAGERLPGAREGSNGREGGPCMRPTLRQVVRPPQSTAQAAGSRCHADLACPQRSIWTPGYGPPPHGQLRGRTAPATPCTRPPSARARCPDPSSAGEARAGVSMHQAPAPRGAAAARGWRCRRHHCEGVLQPLLLRPRPSPPPAPRPLACVSRLLRP